MIVSRVSAKGLTSIPAKVKRALNIEEGDILVWEVDTRRGVAIVKVIKNPVKHLKGKYNDPDLTYDKVEGIADSIVMGELHADN